MKGFEKDVGSKTTLRITYPEGAMQRPEQYERDSLFVLAGFKWQDFKWLKYIVYKERVVSSLLQAPLYCPQPHPPASEAVPPTRTYKEQPGNFNDAKLKRQQIQQGAEARQYQGP